MARQLPKAIRLTDKAADHLRAIMERSEGKYIGLRVGVKNGGCAGMEYTMEWAEHQKPLDEVIEDHGVTVFIDPKAVLFLLGTQMDYQESMLKSGFTFNNPNQTSACGCGESVMLKPAESLPA
ncbi:MAG TPA: iron-sulfur cluster assembly accessory protein [Nordella sp.]|nr:iron-sulfur cluster assembly accessory protein [Nordella sp.]